MKLKLKIPLYFVGALLLSLAAGVGGLLVVSHSLNTFQQDVMQQVDDERAIASLASHFKTQVQEWKDTLLRGSDSALLDKHWTAFGAQQKAVADGAQALRGKLGEDSLNTQLDQFIAAHQKMAAGYADGFEKFKNTGFDSSVGDMAVRGIDREPAKLLEGIGRQIAERRVKVAQAAFADGHHAFWLAIAGMFAACGIGLGVGVLLGRRVVAPLVEATHLARDV
ncbi:MAG TPA: methyl-accepting chemotaxis protein, partial [Methylibium sp.]